MGTISNGDSLSLKEFVAALRGGPERGGTAKFVADVLGKPLPNPAGTKEFVAAIAGSPEPVSTAAFVAEITGKPDPDSTAEFVAIITGETAPERVAAFIAENSAGKERLRATESTAATVREYNFDPDEPRDWHGRWTTGGATGSSTAVPVGSLMRPSARWDMTAVVKHIQANYARRDWTKGLLDALQAAHQRGVKLTPAQVEAARTALSADKAQIDAMSAAIQKARQIGPFAPDTFRYPAERRGLQTSPDYPNLGENYEVLAPSDDSYNCFGYALDPEKPKNVDPTEDNPFGDPSEISREIERAFAGKGYTKSNSMDFCYEPGKQKVVLFGKYVLGPPPTSGLTSQPSIIGATLGSGKLQITHAAIQDQNGTWESKLGGGGPLIRHFSPEQLGGPAYGKPIAVYTGPTTSKGNGR